MVREKSHLGTNTMIKKTYAAVAVAGLLALAGGTASADELVTKCTEASVKAGKPQADAEKYCQCSVDIMKTKLSSEQIDILMMQMNGNAEGAKAAIMKKGQEWALKTAQDFITFAQEAEKACNKQ